MATKERVDQVSINRQKNGFTVEVLTNYPLKDIYVFNDVGRAVEKVRELLIEGEEE